MDQWVKIMDLRAAGLGAGTIRVENQNKLTKSNFLNLLQFSNYIASTVYIPLVPHLCACELFGAKPLTEPMLAYCQLSSWQQIAVKLESESYNFYLS